MRVADLGGAALALRGDVGAVRRGGASMFNVEGAWVFGRPSLHSGRSQTGMSVLPFQHAERLLGPGVAVDGPGAGAGAATGCAEFAAAAFAFEQPGVAEIDEKVVLAVDGF